MERPPKGKAPARSSLIHTQPDVPSPVEAFFGKQRAAGGRNDNPTVQQFCQNTVFLRVQGSAALDPVRDNCGKRERYTIDANSLSAPLAKQPRCAKH